MAIFNLILGSGTVNAINCTIENSIAEGGATFNAFFQNGNIDNGGNSGWDFSWRTLYWVGEGGNWDDTGHWSLSSGGIGGEQIPTLYDNVIFDSASITLEDQSVLFPIDETSNLYSLNMTNLQHHITLGSQGFGSPVKQISCEYHTLILLENGDLHGCGINNLKQLNPSSNISTWFDLSTVLMSGVKQVACGEHHTMVLMENGDVHGWGENNPRLVNPLSAINPWIDQTTVIFSGVKQIACGYHHTMALMENGDVHGWGWNAYRQVNPNSTDDYWTDTSTVILSGVKEISCRNHQTMVLMENGDVRGWGYNYYKQINPAVQSGTWTDSSTVFLSGASKIICGHWHTAILMENGDVHGWGYNSSGQINPSSLSQYAGDTVILSGAKQIACGYYNTMVLMENGDVHGIGGNYYGQINPDYLVDSWVDINTVILSGVQNISCGLNHTVFLMEDGKIHSCGHNVYRESNPSFSTSPWIDTTIEIVPRWQIYSNNEINTHNSTIINSNTAGIFYSLFENNNINGGNNTGWNFGARTLYWIGNSGNWDDADHWSLSSGGEGGAGGGSELYGYNTKEPTILDTLIFDSNSITLEDQTILFPSDVGSSLYSLIMTDLQHQITLNSKDHIDTIKQIACGLLHTMILRENGDVHGWGYNEYGGINPTVINNSYYTDSSTVILSGVKQIACGSHYTIALMENGDVHGWGENIYGQANPTSEFDRWLDPSTVILSGVKQIACGARHTMVLMENGDVHGWGYETRAVNPDSNTTPWLDTSTVFLSGVKQIACGYYHTMVLMENGDVHGWGGDHYGQVNPNFRSDFWIDKNTVILSGVKQIACGSYYTIALMENGDVHGWGGQYFGVNPDSATKPWLDSSTVFLSGVKQIAGGYEHIMVLMENGDVHGWGYNTYREVNPDGSAVNKSTVILSGVAQIDCGSQYTMVLMENGDIRGWGRNLYREVSPSYGDQPFTRTSPVINYIWDIVSASGEINAHKSTIKNSRPDGASIYYALTEDENIDGGNNIRGYNSNPGWIFDPFIFTVNADIITLPLSYGVDNFIVDWGDGTSDHITSYEDPKITHQYDTFGLYDISIKGQFTGWNITYSSDIRLKIVDIKQWGCISFYFANGKYFDYCSNLIISATDIPYLDIPTSLEKTFEMCSSITDIPNINQWNISNVINISSMFYSAQFFNSDITSWDTSNITNMSGAFSLAKLFNQNISSWDVSNVTNMYTMFSDAASFNQPLNNWNVSNVTDMRYMFSGTMVGNQFFNQPLNNWNTSSVTDMSYMFSINEAFDQDISMWDISNVVSMTGMFFGSGLSTENYEKLLQGWSAQDVQLNVTFDAGSSKYHVEYAQYKDILLAKGWVITDGGVEET